MTNDDMRECLKALMSEPEMLDEDFEVSGGAAGAVCEIGVSFSRGGVSLAEWRAGAYDPRDPSDEDPKAIVILKGEAGDEEWEKYIRRWPSWGEAPKGDRVPDENHVFFDGSEGPTWSNEPIPSVLKWMLWGRTAPAGSRVAARPPEGSLLRRHRETQREDIRVVMLPAPEHGIKHGRIIFEGSRAHFLEEFDEEAYRLEGLEPGDVKDFDVEMTDGRKRTFRFRIRGLAPLDMLP